MLGDLYINGNDAWGTYRVAMGEGFIQTLLTPAGNKDFIENEIKLRLGSEQVE